MLSMEKMCGSQYTMELNNATKTLDLLNAGNSAYTFGTSESSLIDSQIATNKISMRAYNIATGENQYIIDSGV